MSYLANKLLSTSSSMFEGWYTFEPSTIVGTEVKNTQGKAGSATLLNGVTAGAEGYNGDGVFTPSDTPFLQLPQGDCTVFPFTVALDIMPQRNGIGAFNGIVMKTDRWHLGGSTSLNNGWALKLVGGRYLELAIGGGTGEKVSFSYQNNSPDFPRDSYTRVAFIIRSKKDVSMYINGKDISATAAISGDLLDTMVYSGVITDTIQLGSIDNNGVRATFDNLRFWNREPTAPELGLVLSLNPLAVPITQYDMLDLTNDIVVDNIGAQNGTVDEGTTGTPLGDMLTLVSTRTTAKILTLPANSCPNTGPVTMMFWLNEDKSGGQGFHRNVFTSDKWTTTEKYGYKLIASGSGRLYWSFGDGAGYRQYELREFKGDASPLPDNDWRHVTITWDGIYPNRPVTYMNGEQMDLGSGSTGSATSVAASGSPAPFLGSRIGTPESLNNFTTEGWTGLIGAHSFYDKVLTSTEVYQEYRRSDPLNI